MKNAETLENYFQVYYKDCAKQWAMCYRNLVHTNTDSNMYVESFHNVLKTYYMERKPNKRVNALIVVLFIYKENTYWRHKQERIYATKYQSPNNNSGHTRGMAVVNEQLTVVNETNRKEKSQSKGKSMKTFDCFWLPNIINSNNYHFYYCHCYYYYYYYHFYSYQSFCCVC